ncbi:C40 family peptidase [Paenibacillus sp. URB8-2]|uniref:C40 family peptidase n=1 Tax=Paenibacillus sp. URB8-2 TaxID=2741301 RepID=UPI0015BCBCD7|nr:C40 family peptidase [Paenibacillus sp. URB8-2]BCG60440.1 hypothetical protein PUR_38650 [Paenibacillus sp. URB8-2]
MKKKSFIFVALAASISFGSLNVSSISAASQSTAVQTSNLRENVINSGMKYLGTPYEFGSSRSNTQTFDCSDFVRQAYKEGTGVTIPPDSRKQGAYVKENGSHTKNWQELKPGDIMFFMSYRGNNESSYTGIDKNTARITHNGIYLGNGKILHTYSKKSGGVRIDNIPGTQWEKRFLFGGSTLN